MKKKTRNRSLAIALTALLSAGLGYFFSLREEPQEYVTHLSPKLLVPITSSPSPIPLPAAIRADHHQRHPSRSGGVMAAYQNTQAPKKSADPAPPPKTVPAQVPIYSDVMDPSIASIEREIAALEELKILKERNRIIHLADQVIISGKRADFAKLERFAAACQAPELKESVDLQVLRVDRHFHSRRKTRRFPLNVSDFFPEKDSEDALTVGELLQILIDGKAPAEARIRAAELLGQIPPGDQPRLPGYLLYTAEHAIDLDLIDEALLSFSKLTGVYPNRMFDAVPAAVWWDFNNPEKATTAQSAGSR